MEAQGNEAVVDSAIVRLREQHAELRRERTLDLRVPGWSGMLVARYTPVRAGEMRKLASRVDRLESQATPEADLAAAADLIITTCKEILVVVDGEKRTLQDEAGKDAPVRFDKQLAEILGFEAESAREVVYGCFPQFPDGSPIETTINAHALEVAEWITNVDEEVSSDLGEG
jgi:hypothetical protein